MNAEFDSSLFPRHHSNSEAHVAIVTDSIAQVPIGLAQQLGIRIIPFSVTVNDTTYTDGVDLKPAAIYQRMRQEKDLRLVTSAPTPGEYYSTFTECHAHGAASILYVGLTSKLSGALITAEGIVNILREEHKSFEIKLYDSHLATMAQGFIAIEAARLANQGASLDQIVEHLEKERRRAGFAVGLETLEYLARGGRIGKVAFFLGNTAHILPIVSFNEDGVVIPVSRVHGYNHLLKEIVHCVSHKVTGFRSLSLGVMHADSFRWAEELRSLAVEMLHPDEIYITDFTPVMAAHTGPGTIGLAYYWRP